MAVEQLGGVAHRVRGDGALALHIQLPAGLRREDHLEIQAGEQLKQKGRFSYMFRPKGMPMRPGSRPLSLALEGAELCVFIAHQVGQVGGLLPQRAGAPVARDKAPAAVKGVDSQGAVVGAQSAGGGLGGVGELLQGLGGEHRALLQVQVPGGQGRAEGPHDAGDGGAGHVPAQLLLKARRTASLRKVPPWTTMCLPRSSAEAARMTL